MRPLEFNGIVSRSQDVSLYRQNEEVRPAVEQQSILHNIEKDAEVKKEQVYQKKDEDMDAEYDAKNGKGGMEYNSNGKKKKKEDEEGIVKIKSSTSFDIRV